MKDRSAARFGDLQTNESNLPSAAFSPDGQFVAYSGGTGGVFVQPFQSAAANKILVDQGIHPMWSADGKELLYRRRGQTFSVSVTTKPAFSFGKPTLVKLVAYRQRGPTVEREYDLTRDGKQFAVVFAAGFSEAIPQTQIQVVTNWFEELKQRVPIPK